MNKNALISASQLLNQDYLQAEKQLSAFNMTTNLYDAIAKSGAFDNDLVSKIQTEKIKGTNLTDQKTQIQSEQSTLMPFDTAEEQLSVSNMNTLTSLELPEHYIIENYRLGERGFSGGNYSGAYLRDTNLAGADFSKTDLAGADLRDSDLSNSKLSEATLDGASLVDTNLRDSNLAYAQIMGADLRNATLAGADLTGANLAGADLAGADLAGADLTGANLANTHLSYTNLTNTNLTGADLTGTDLADTQLVHHTVLPTNLYDAVAESRAFDNDLVSKIQTEKIEVTNLTDQKTQIQSAQTTQIQSEQSTLISFDTKVKEKLAKDSLDKKQNQLIEIASSLTHEIKPDHNSVDVSMNMIGKYEIWRDKDDIAIINAKENKIVAYGNNSQDFFPIKIEESQLERFNSPEKLLGKIAQYNPQMKLQYDKNAVDDAHEKLKPLDPVLQAINRQETRPKKSIGQKISSSVKDFVKSLQKFTNKGSQKIGDLTNELLLNAKDRTNSIGSKLLSERIMKHSLQKFEEAFNRTGEQSYSLENYTIQKVKDQDIIQVLDQNNELLIDYRVQNDGATVKPEFRSSYGDLKKLNEAAKVITDPKNKFFGSVAKENEYQSKVFGILKELASYKNGKTQLADTDQYLIKTENSISLQDSNGNRLIVADKNQNSSIASRKELNNIKKALQINKHDLKQQELVEKIAPTIKQYLELNQRTTINKDNFLVSYDPQSKVINYQDKSDPDNFLKAEHTKKGWLRIKSNITPAKEKYFEDVAKKTNDFVQKQNLASNKNQKRGGQSR